MAGSDILQEIVKNVTRLYGIHESTLESMKLLNEKIDRLNERIDIQSGRIRVLEQKEVDKQADKLLAEHQQL